MPIHGRPYWAKSYLAAFICIILFLCTMTAPMAAQEKVNKPPINEHKRIIVLDPGHGGYDKGAKGPGGTYEKTTALSIARIIASEIGDKYKVVLTRTDDYRVDIPGRTAIANHLKADMFISIHTGGSFLHKASGMSIFHYKKISGLPFIFETKTTKRLEKIDTNTPWNDIQNTHATASTVLADLIKNSIQDQIKDLEIKIQSAPLLVLSGADMPGVLIEIGYLTNPAEEKTLGNANFLSAFAKAISNGIDIFFKQNSTISFIDLRE